MTPLRWLPGAALAALLACLVLVQWRLSPPAAKPASAPPGEFSAERAFAVLERVLAEKTPHPMGSPEQRRVRARIEARLAELGWSVRVQRAPICSRYGACGFVENILAERPGPPGPRLLLAAHYDSVPAGPGASDDGIGIAALLEVARALGHRPTRLPVMLLFSDGEESGLLGAEAFVRDELPRQEIAALINVEARGTSGAALLFETSGPNDWLVGAFARASGRPVTSSLFPAVYERLPNDTDLSVFKRAGVPGVNLANIGGFGRYHTPKDDLDHLSLRTLQHHGDAALGLAVELGPRPPGAAPALFFDVLGLGVVRAPLSSAVWLHTGATVLWLVALGLAFRRGARATRFLKSFGLWPLLIGVLTLLGYGLGASLSAVGALGSGFPAHPEPFFLCLAAHFVALCLLALALVETGGQELWLAGWTCVGFAGWGALAVLPEASFLFLVPWLAAALGGLVTRGDPRRLGLAVLLPAVVALLLWLPVLLLAHDALGLTAPALFAACAWLATGGLAPALTQLGARPRRFLLGFSASVALLSAVVAANVPVFSAESPQRLSLALHLDADTGRARYLVDASSGPVPRALVEAGRFAPKVIDSAPSFIGWRAEALEAAAPTFELPAPAWEREGQRVRVRSERGASTLTLHFEPESALPVVGFHGLPAPLRPGARFRSLTLLGVGPEGALLELSGSGSALLSDHSPGLPPSAAPLVVARPAWAEPSQSGDETLVSRKVSF